MTPFQADLFVDFGSLGCVDSTHKTNECGYKLITLVVADEYQMVYNKKLLPAVVSYFEFAGLPVAWGITETEDVNT